MVCLRHQVSYITIELLVMSRNICLHNESIWQLSVRFWTGSRASECFTNNFSMAIQIRWKFHVVVIQFWGNKSLQIFAHAMTAELSWHKQNRLAITLLEFGLDQNEVKNYIFYGYFLWSWNTDTLWTVFLLVWWALVSKRFSKCIARLCFYFQTQEIISP